MDEKVYPFSGRDFSDLFIPDSSMCPKRMSLIYEFVGRYLICGSYSKNKNIELLKQLMSDKVSGGQQ